MRKYLIPGRTGGLLAALCSLLALSPLAAQQGGRTIEALVEEALASNPELQSYEQEVAAARGQRTQAGFFKNPEVSTEIGAREVRDDANVLQGNGTTFSIAVTQTFEFPGKGTLRKAIAARHVEIAELGLAQFRMALAAKVRLLAYEMLAAESETQLASATARTSQGVLDALRAQPAAGARLALESRLIEASLLELFESERETAARREEARAELALLLGRPADSPVPIRAALAAPGRRQNVSELVLAAQSRNPLLAIRKADLARAANELSAARLDIAPDFSAGPFFSRDVSGDVEQNIGASISATVPVWDWNVGNIATARARRTQAELLRVLAERQVENAIVRQARLCALIDAQLAKTPPGLEKSAGQSADLGSQQYLAGAIGASLFLDSQNAALRSRQILNRALLDAWRARLDLDLLSGSGLSGKEAR